MVAAMRLGARDALPGGGTGARSPTAISVAAATAALGVVGALAFDAGGYFPTAYLTGGAVALAALGLLLVVHLPRFALSTHALTALGTLALLAAWTGLSAAWSPAPDAALADLQRDLLYVALFGLGLVAAGSGRHAVLVGRLVFAVIVFVAGAGLLSRLAPDLVPTDAVSPEVAALTGDRLAYPLSYWNAFGALAAVGVVLGAGMGSDPHAPVWLRALCGAAVVPLAVAVYLSLSRGAWLALMAGAVVLVALGAHRGSLLLTTAVAGVAAALAIVRVNHGGSLGAVALLTGAAGAVIAVIAAGRASPNMMQALRRVVRPLLIAAAGLAIAVAFAAYVVKADAVEGRADRGLRSAGDFVSRQWQDFLRPTTGVQQGSARLTTAKGTRSDLYRVAFDGFEAHPLRGDGAGGFTVRWMQDRRVYEAVRDAHSLELETLGELGAIGGLILLAFLGTLVWAAVRSRVRRVALPRAHAAAVGAACSVWVAHSAVDWDWQMPALTGCVLVLAATLYPVGTTRRRRTASGAATGVAPRDG
jgi:O-antigen ligase/polysaccharide polymerase Wzy-like membrane protein